jgi:heme exporter protein B
MFKSYSFIFYQLRSLCTVHVFKIYIFFILLLLLFPILFSPIKILFEYFFFNVFWFSILITNFLSLDSLFKDDFKMGFFDFFLVQKKSLELYIIIKIFIYWIFNIIPILGTCLLLSYLIFNLSFNKILLLFILVSLQTLSLTFLNAIGSIFLYNNTQNYLLIFLMLIPLVIPLLVFGVTLMTSVIYIGFTSFHFILIFGNFCFLLCIIPWLISYLIRININ